MEFNQGYRLNNGEQIIVLKEFHHYHSDQTDFLIKTANNQNYIISREELAELLKKPRSTEEKLALYLRYFSGRLDVYAQKWSNGKGYSPALKNWWDFYNLRNNKAAQNKLTKEYLPYTTTTIFDQITKDDGYHRFGIYPLLPGDLTKLLVFDLDQHGGPDPRDTTKAILVALHKYHINCLPEISSSGNSYHIWLFFSEPVPAKSARLLGKLILAEAMLNSSDVTLDCFDRMIPNQDRLPNNGFGNLIALPLKWGDVQQKRSIFTDDDLSPLPPAKLFDQLEQTKQYTTKELSYLIDKIKDDRGILNSDNEILGTLSITYLPKKITGVIRGELLINRQDLTHREQLALLSLVTFTNPEFNKKQWMRAPVWNIPSMLTAASYDSRFLHLPRGVLPLLVESTNCQLTEEFTDAKPLNVTFKGELRAEQSEAITKLNPHSLGMICAHTGFGKTVVGCALIAKRKVRTLIVVPTQSIAKQWQSSAQTFLKIENLPDEELSPKRRKIKKSTVEVISGTRNHPSHLVDIVNIRKLTHLTSKEREKFYQSYGQIIIDECHHIAAITFEKVLLEANTRFIVGLTATPERNDGLEKFMYLRCGQIYYQSRPSENNLIHRYLYPRYNGVGEYQQLSLNENYPQKLAELVEDPERNLQIINDVIVALSENRHILLLSERVKHLKILYQELKAQHPDAQIQIITGSTKEKLNIKDETKPYVILSTSKYVGEGFDMPSLDTLFFTLPFAWRGNTQQYLGRLERGLSDKDELRVYDYVDIADDTFAKMFKKRSNVYRKLGYEIVPPTNHNNYAAQYFDWQTYEATWIHDIDQATDIFIRVRTLSRQLIQILNDQASQNKRISLNLKEADDIHQNNESLEHLLSPKVNIQWSKQIGNQLCIFDHKTCWYGDLNFGSKCFPTMSAIRFVNSNLAKQTTKSK